MSYVYEVERNSLFTDDGQRLLLKVRDNANRLLDAAGAFMADKAWEGCSGNSWHFLAALDRLVELGEIVRVDNPTTSWGQCQIYVRHGRG